MSAGPPRIAACSAMSRCPYLTPRSVRVDSRGSRHSRALNVTGRKRTILTGIISTRRRIGQVESRAGFVTALLGCEESRVSPIRSDAQSNLAKATRTPALVGCPLRIAIDPRICAAAVKVNADPRTPAQVPSPASKRCRVFQLVDVEVIGRWLFHRVIYRLAPAPFSRSSRTNPSTDSR